MNSPIAENAPAHGGTSRFSQFGDASGAKVSAEPVLEDPSGELEKELMAQR